MDLSPATGRQYTSHASHRATPIRGVYHGAMHFRTILLAVAVLALAPGLAAPARAQSSKLPLLRIASGPSGQTYREVYAIGVASRFPRYRIQHLQTAGSAENLDLLVSGKADVAFAQADVYAQLLRSGEARYKVAQVIGRLADECVYVARRDDGPVESLASLGAKIDGRAPRVAVGPEGGGARWTWKHLVAIRPDLAAAEVAATTGNLALNQLEVGLFDAFLWVTDPGNRDHPLLRGVRQKDALSILPIEDASLEEKLPSGLPVYQIQEVQLDRGPMNTDGLAPKVKTLCTFAAVFARMDADPKLIDKLSEVVSLHRDAIVRKR